MSGELRVSRLVNLKPTIEEILDDDRIQSRIQGMEILGEGENGYYYKPEGHEVVYFSRVRNRYECVILNTDKYNVQRRGYTMVMRPPNLECLIDIFEAINKPKNPEVRHVIGYVASEKPELRLFNREVNSIKRCLASGCTNQNNRMYDATVRAVRFLDYKGCDYE